jgi:methionyl-tRNA synthetase
MREFKRYLVTSALPYANGPLHIGHLAGAYLPADIYVRFLRMMDKDVAFICGSDEHGAAITMKAIKEELTPQQIVDKYHQLFESTFKKMGISFDIYHRTSDPLHHETAQGFFRKLHEQKVFEEKESEQYFDEKANQFLADRYIKGTCPKCGYEEAYGDQCESCGASLSPMELKNPFSVISGEKPVVKSTTHWYLPLNKYENWLREWISDGTLEGKALHYPEDWKNHVVGQCKSWLDGGLQPRAMTRDLDWGVDLPKELPGSEGKKLYVWMDAPIGYVSATRQWAANENKDWEKYWKDEETALIHFIGKDNIVFHCLIFPAILKAHGDYILPYNVPANQFMNLEGKKISTSRNWAVWVHEFAEDMPDRIDEMRYSLIKNMPELKDSEFTWKSFQDSTNNELVANLANFTNRVLVLFNKYYEGVVPEFDEDESFTGSSGEEFEYFDSEMLSLHDAMQDVASAIHAFDFRTAMKHIMEISSMGNQLLQYNEPWKLIKTEPEAVKTIMTAAIQYLTALSVAVRPFMPEASEKMRRALNFDMATEQGEWIECLNLLAEGELLLKPGHKIGEAMHLFTRIDDAVIENQVQKLKASTEAVQANDETKAESNGQIKSPVDFDSFIKLDLRTAQIIEAERVEKADKLLKLKLDLGFEQRTVVSGIAKHYTPEDVIGKKVTLLANLEPRKIRGVVSHGMILMSESSDGRLQFVSCPEDAELGAKIS